MEPPNVMGNDEFDVFATPSKDGSRLTLGKRSANEENEQNGTNTTNNSMMNKRMKGTPPNENLGHDRNPASSDCGTDDVSSSTHSQTNLSFKSPPVVRSTPRRPIGSASSSSAASVLVQRLVDNKTNFANASRTKAFTPIQVKPRINKKEVQATNDGYASVAKLSAWLADDPTSKKKMLHVRKGRNVIAKSRQFEKDMEGVIVEEAKISRGAVKDKKKWLSEAFHEEEDKEIDGVKLAKGAVSDRKKWLQGAFGGNDDQGDNTVRYARSEIGGYVGTYRYKGTPGRSARRESTDSSSRSEIVTDDAASMMSVSDKKDWLKNAFKGAGATPTKFGSPGLSLPPKARSEVLHCRGDRRDDVSTRAKKKWSEFSARKLAAKNAAVVKTLPPSVDETGETEERTGPPEVTSETTNITTAITTTAESKKKSTTANIEPVKQTTKAVVEEDRTQLGFSAARKILLKRSKANGNELHVISKVQRRKEKFEKLNQENRRRSGAKGLLRPSWGAATPSKGRPSDAYTKSFVEDIAPKKSFEELP